MNYTKEGFEKEKEARKALEVHYGQPFSKKVLSFNGLSGGRGRKEFDAVSADGSIVAEVKNSQWSGAALSGIQGDLEFLRCLDGVKIKLMVLFNKRTYLQFKRRDDEMRNLRRCGVSLVGPDSDILGGPEKTS